MTNAPGVEGIGMRAVIGAGSSAIISGADGMRMVCGGGGTAMIGGGGGCTRGALGGAGGIAAGMRIDARLITASGFDGLRELEGALFGGSGIAGGSGAGAAWTGSGGGGLLAGPRGATDAFATIGAFGALGALGAIGALGAVDGRGGGADETRTAGSGAAGRFPGVLCTWLEVLGSAAIAIRKFQVA